MKKLNIAVLTVLLVFQTLLSPLATYASGDTSSTDFATPSGQQEGNTDGAAEPGSDGATDGTDDTIFNIPISTLEGEISTPPTAGVELTDNIITSVELYDNLTRDAAGNVTGFGNNLDMTKTPYQKPNVNNQAFMYFKWQLPAAGVAAGSTFSFKLPDAFKMASAVSGGLSGIDGGTYTVTQTGDVTLTFTEAVSANSTEGYFWVGSGFDQSKLGDSTQVDVAFDFKGVITTIPIKFQNNVTTGMTKEGVADRQKNPTKIEWTVDINLKEENLSDAYFVDTLPDGLELDGNVTFTPLKVDLNGNKTVDGTKPIITKAELSNVSLGNNGEQAYRVTYSTKVTGDFTGSQPFKNTAKLYEGDPTNGGVEKGSDSATVNTTFNTPLEKSVDSNYDFVKGEITWTVKYNYNQKDVNGILNDTMTTTGQATSKHAFKEFVSVNEVTFDGNGNELVGADVIATTKFENSQIKLIGSGTTDKAYKIVYKTKVDDRVTGNLEHVNKVCMNDKPTEECKTARITVSQKIISKTSSINYADQTITWTITVNEDEREMPGNTIVRDTFGSNLTLANAADIKVNGTPVESANVTLLSPKEDGSTTTGFELNLGASKFYDVKTITYTTKFNPRVGDVNTARSYTNTAGVGTKDIDGNLVFMTANVSPSQSTGTYTTQNGNKTGVYDATTKTIKWEIIANYNLHMIENGVLTDTYMGTQDFVEKSFKVEELTLGTGANSISSGKVICSGTTCGVTNTGNTITYNFPKNTDKAYRITYETSLNGHEVKGSYTNKAVLKDGTNPAIFDKTATVTPEYSNDSAVKKTGYQSGDLAKWKVTVNPQQSKIASGAKIEDSLTGDHKLVEGSFKLYQVNVGTDGKIGNYNDNGLPNNKTEVTSGYALHVDPTTKQSFTLTFNTDIEKPYILVYDTYIQADHDVTIKNGVSFNGSFSGSSSLPTSGEVKVNWALAGGGANTKKGKLQIKKVDANDKNIKLSGAEFEIYNNTGEFLLETVTTDSNGIATTVNDYRYVKYKVKETVAPEGYKLPTPNPFEVTFKNDSATGYGIAEISNEVDKSKSCTKYVLTLRDSTGNIRPNVEVTIKDLANNVMTNPIDNTKVFTTDSNGQITFANPFTEGQYKVFEGKADLGTFELSFTPGECQGELTLTQACPLFTITVKDENGKNATGKEVTIVNSNGVEVKKDSTDSSGKITLPPTTPLGQYKVYEGTKFLGDITVSFVAGLCQDEVQIPPSLACEQFTITVKDEDGKIRKNTSVSIQVNLKGTDGVITTETLSLTTNEDGLVKLPANTVAGKYKVYDGNILTKELGEVTVSYKDGECQGEVQPNRLCDIFTITVKKPDGTVNSGVKVIVEDSKGNQVPLTNSTTDSDGKIKLPQNQEPGDYTVYEVNPDGSKGEEIGEVTVTYTDNCKGDVIKNACPQFTLTVNNSDLQPVGPNVGIVIKKADGTIVANSTTNTAGQIEYSKASNTLEQGETYIVFTTSGVKLGTITVSYIDGICGAVVQIPTNVCPIFTLTVQDPYGKERPNVTVTIKDSNDKTITTGTTDSSGKLTVPYSVEPGTYKVYEGATLLDTVTVENCEATVKPDLPPVTPPTPGGGGDNPGTDPDPKPEDPNNPDPKPEDPNNPDPKPEDPNKPGKPGEPGTPPTTPGKPGEPGTPPTTPGKPGTPGTNPTPGINPGTGVTPDPAKQLPPHIVNEINDLKDLILGYPSVLPTKEELDRLLALYNEYLKMTPEQKRAFEKLVDINALRDLLLGEGVKLPQTDGNLNTTTTLFGLALLAMAAMLIVRRRKAVK